MNELKCKECGAALVQGATECPSCGCPIEEVKIECAAPTKTQTAKKKVNVISILPLLLGIVIIVMGITVMNKGVSIDTYSAKHYDADYAAFGGDFYTEIYGVTDMIVDELNDINSGVEVLSESMATMASVIYYSTGMIIIALDLGVVAVSCNHIKKENA